MGILDDFKMQYKLGGSIQKLLFWNVGISAVFLIIQSFFPNLHALLLKWVGLSYDASVVITRPWTLFTYSFLHANIVHLLFNMIILNFIGRLFVTFFRGNQFLFIYFFGVFFGGISYILANLFFNTGIYLVGASAGIVAALVALATYSPYMQVRLLLIGNVKMWHIALALIVIDLIQIPLSNTGGHIAHLGGALSGFVYIKLIQNGTDLNKIFTNGIDSIISFFNFNKKYTPFKKVYVKPKDKRGNYTKSTINKNEDQQRVDYILEKISKSGYDSLSKEEKNFLFSKRE